MRNSKLKAAELEQAEFDERQSRNNGLSMMAIRDRGWARLSTGQVMEWPVGRELEEGVPRRQIPEGMFFLDDKPYDVDEFRKFLRWA